MTDDKSEYPSPEAMPKKNPLLITRKEIIELLGRSDSFADSFIKRHKDFPSRVSYGCYSRKEVMTWLKDKGFI